MVYSGLAAASGRMLSDLSWGEIVGLACVGVAVGLAIRLIAGKTLRNNVRGWLAATALVAFAVWCLVQSLKK